MKNSKRKFLALVGSAWGTKLLVLALICLLMLVFQRKFFLPANWASILRAIAIYGIMACGMLFVVLVGGMDLSMGSMGALAAAIVAMRVVNSGYAPGSFLLGLALAMAVCVAVGLLHSFLVTRFRMNAFVVTLATKYILYGAVMLVTKNAYTYIMDKESFLYRLGSAKLAGVPLPVVVFVVYALVCVFVLGGTTFGRRLYAVGGNARAAELVGVRSKRVICLAFVISSVSAGLGGVLLASMNTVAGSGTASGYEGNVLMAMVVGGVNLAGGQGSILDAIYGALLVGMINNIQVLVGIPPEYQEFVRGLIILVALSLNVYAGRKAQGLIPPRQKRDKRLEKAAEPVQAESAH